MSKKIVLTGGGTAGHVTPNIALIPHLREAGYEIVYIGSYDGIEKRLISDFPEIPYHGIATGKFRRYLDFKNLTDPFRVIKGYAEERKTGCTVLQGWFCQRSRCQGGSLSAHTLYHPRI